MHFSRILYPNIKSVSIKLLQSVTNHTAKRIVFAKIKLFLFVVYKFILNFAPLTFQQSIRMWRKWKGPAKKSELHSRTLCIERKNARCRREWNWKQWVNRDSSITDCCHQLRGLHASPPPNGSSSTTAGAGRPTADARVWQHQEETEIAQGATPPKM